MFDAVSCPANEDENVPFENFMCDWEPKFDFVQSGQLEISFLEILLEDWKKIYLEPQTDFLINLREQLYPTSSFFIYLERPVFY